jgi:hypothetical protein
LACAACACYGGNSGTLKTSQPIACTTTARQVGDEMGLGKTVQACALLWCYRDEWPALIVAPSSLRWGARGLPLLCRLTNPTTLLQSRHERHPSTFSPVASTPRLHQG